MLPWSAERAPFDEIQCSAGARHPSRHLEYVSQLHQRRRQRPQHVRRHWGLAKVCACLSIDLLLLLMCLFACFLSHFAFVATSGSTTTQRMLSYKQINLFRPVLLSLQPLRRLCWVWERPAEPERWKCARSEPRVKHQPTVINFRPDLILLLVNLDQLLLG